MSECEVNNVNIGSDDSVNEVNDFENSEYSIEFSDVEFNSEQQISNETTPDSCAK